MVQINSGGVFSDATIPSVVCAASHLLCVMLFAETYTYSCSVNTTALSRLLLNLRDVAHGSQRTMTPMSTVQFSQVIGPLGNVVHDGLSFLDGEEGHEVDEALIDSEHIQLDTVGGE